MKFGRCPGQDEAGGVGVVDASLYAKLSGEDSFADDTDFHMPNNLHQCIFPMCGATAQACRIGSIEGLLCSPADGGVVPVELVCRSDDRSGSGDEGERSHERGRSRWDAHRDRSQGDVRPAMAH